MLKFNHHQPITFYLFVNNKYHQYTEQDLADLGSRRARIWVQMFPDIADFAHIPLSERRSAIDAWSKATYDRVTNAVPMTIIKSRGKQDYQTFTCELAAADVPRLLREDGISSARLKDIAGAELSEIEIRGRGQAPWYAVQARFVIQVEDVTRGMQTYEDRILLVRAWDFDDAVKRLEPEFAHYEQSYFNSDWQIVRWKFERVLDVYKTDLLKIDPHGTEVFSQMKERRMRPA